MATATLSDRLVSHIEIARCLSVSPTTVRRWASVGKLPTPRIIANKMYWAVDQAADILAGDQAETADRD